LVDDAMLGRSARDRTTGDAMTARFVRCPHCNLPHGADEKVCPTAKKPIHREAGATGASQVTNAGKRPGTAAPAKLRRTGGTVAVRTQDRDLIGKTIAGKYDVKGVLGEGGMGTVYEAENTALGRSVAVKVLHPAQARKKTAVKRFHQEARAAGAIGHPNICEVYDLGTLDDGSPFLVMERLLGETLGDRIASEGGLPLDDVIDVLTQVLSGLVVAHEKGIVHRDIKPENVFLSKRVGCPPVAKLLDFGVSKMISAMHEGARDADLDLTRTGMVMGTPYYMAPEQARGDRILDARVDVYACGVMMYEALTGRRPFTGPNYNALLLNILRSDPRPARELRPALPRAFDRVLEKSMARPKEDRYQNATEFQQALSLLRTELSKAPPIAPIYNADAHAIAPRYKTRASKPSAKISSTSVPAQKVARDALMDLPKLDGDDDEYGEGAAAMQPTELRKSETPLKGRRRSPLIDAPAPLAGTQEEKSDEWDDATTRVVRGKYVTDLRDMRKRAGQTIEDENTVKIDGDLEAHFREMEKNPSR
jgi:serine/threonine protein kinase